MKRILAIKLRQLGDVVLWTAALKNLKEAYPDSEIEVLIYDYAKPILENQPGIFKIHTITPKSSLFLKILELRKNRYNLVLGFHATTSLCRLGWMFYPSTTVFHHHSIQGKPFWSKLEVPHAGKLENVLLRDQRVLEALGIQLKVTPPKLVQTSKVKSGILLLPGASIETKRYPEDLWKQLVSELPQGKLAVACDSALSEQWGLKNFLGKLNIPLYDNLSLGDFLKKISEFEIAIANDSGPLHMAAALGLKTIALFGPTCVGDWHPYQSKINLLIRKHVDCRDKGPQDQDAFRYCTLETCSHHSCLQKIMPQEIKQKLAELA